MTEKLNLHETLVGVVGLGLMGSSIVAALLIAGHEVKAVAPLPADAADAIFRINNQLQKCREAGLISYPHEYYAGRLTLSEDYRTLQNCTVVIECVIENIDIKASVYRQITAVVKPETIIATNTSAIPISVLQKLVEHPERFLGIHWAEPATMTRFLEVTCGNLTAEKHAESILRLAHQWNKEPTFLKKDIRGFITNRLMYAVYREIFHLLDNGTAQKEDVDKAFRYDAGSWMTLMGIFRRMDYMGLKDFAPIMENLFPQLSNSTEVPEVMQEMVRNSARGVHNGIGLYPYAEGEAKQWEDAFADFNRNIHHLAAAYSADKVKEQVGYGPAGTDRKTAKPRIQKEKK
ncbi:3-hydroxyacyl-CoA dehydrogenase family protein [Dyadobacter bucti]|uniref:3-hydroxyacyl-CoA dehydrogenase family protein n=1 Tax=Dyadobacter bucti TaxID=2572203 RepID=UPI003F6E8801